MKAEQNIGTWTPEQLSDYVSGQLSQSDAHRLERDMLEDPFLREAMEGFGQAGQGVDMQSLGKKWSAKMKSEGTGNNGILGPIALGLVVVSLIGIGTMLIKQQEVSDLADQVGQSMEDNAVQAQVYEDSLGIMEIRLAQIIVAEKEIRPEATREEQTAIKAQDEAQAEQVEPTEDARATAPPSIEPLSYNTDEGVSASKKLAEPKPEIFYLHDLKLADHRATYEDERYVKGEWTTGTAARYEREQEGITQIPSIVQISYEQVMEEAMSHFSKRDYKSTLLMLKRIEKRHANDANVDFYGGLCYYNLSKFAKADLYFRRALNHPSRVFDQEARWHLVRSLLDQEKYERAKYHLRTIVDEDEFYASRARQMLSSLE